MKHYSIIEAILMGVLSGILMIFAFPEWDYYPLAFIAFVPLSMILMTSSYKKIILSMTAFVLVFYGALLFWITYFHISAYPSTVIALAVYYSAVGCFYRFISKRFPSLKILLLPLVFTCFEYLRTVGFLKFPYGHISYSQTSFLHFIQIADITGHLGVSFLLYLWNASIADFLVRFLPRHKLRLFIKTPAHYVLNRFSLLFILSGLVLFYGHLKLNDPESPKPIKVSMVQMWFDFNQPFPRWPSEPRKKLYEKLTRLSTLAKAHNPDMIIWPETALQEVYEYYSYHNLPPSSMYKKFFSDFNKKGENTYFLFGTLSMRFLAPSSLPQTKDAKSARGSKTKFAGPTRQIFNSALFLNPAGKVIDRYSKMLLVPFAEWFPYTDFFKKFFPPLLDLLQAAQAANFTPGEHQTIFSHPNMKFAVLICYEDCFAEFCRAVVKKGAKALIVITNDAWSYTTKSEVIHNSFSIFRAIENRKAVLRAANAGVTCVIDPKGRIMKSLPLFEEGVLTQSIPVNENTSIFTLYGYSYIYFLLLTVLIFFIAAIFLKKKHA